MTSTVTNFSNNINVSYPIPGVDNDTQGFRDNFANIKNALSAAASELSDLNLYTSKLNTGTNDYTYGATIFRAPLKSVGFVITVDDDQLADKEISFLTGNYHKLSLGGVRTLTITDFPAGLYSTMRLELLNQTTGTTTVTFDTNGNIKKEDNFTLPMTLSTDTGVSHVLDLWSIDGGSTVFVKFIGTFTNYYV